MIFQIIFVVFTLASLGTMVAALVKIWRSPHLTWKLAWTLGSLVGFVGLGIDWSEPNDLYVQVGVAIPIVHGAFFFATESVAIKTLFPIIAAIAIFRVDSLTDEVVETFK